MKNRNSQIVKLTFLSVLLFLSSCKVISFFPLYTHDKVILTDKIEGVYSTENGQTNYYILGKQNFLNGLVDTIPDKSGKLHWKSGFSLPEDLSMFFVELNVSPIGESNSDLDPANYKDEDGYILVEDSGPNEAPIDLDNDVESQACYFFDRYSFKWMVLVELDGKIYADFEPIDFEDVLSMDDDYLSVHTFAQIDIQKDSLAMSFMKEKFLEELFDQNRIRLPHVKREDDGKILLTASSKELQKFVVKFAEDEKAFDSKNKLIKIQGV